MKYEHKDSTGNVIKKGDLILYGYRFDTPVIGKVLGSVKSGVRYVYPYKSYRGDIAEIASICKRPHNAIIVNHLRNDIVTRQLFNLDLIDYDMQVYKR